MENNNPKLMHCNVCDSFFIEEEFEQHKREKHSSGWHNSVDGLQTLWAKTVRDFKKKKSNRQN